MVLTSAFAWTTINMSAEEMAARSGEPAPEGAHVWGAFVDEASGAYGRLLVMCTSGAEDPVGVTAVSLYLPFTRLDQNDFLVLTKGDGGASTAPFHIEMLPGRGLDFAVGRPEGTAAMLDVLLTSTEVVLSFEPARFESLRFDVSGFEFISEDWPCLDDGAADASPTEP